MHLSKFQKKVVKQYNENIRAGLMSTIKKPCLCGQGECFDQVYSNDRYGLWCPSVICRSCGLVQLNPRLTDAEYSKFYSSDDYRMLYGDENYLEKYKSKFEDPDNSHIFTILSPTIEKYNLNNVLEFGCGGGWKLLPFYKAGYDVTGYDYSPNLVKLGRTYGLNLFQGSTEDIDGKYDAIVINHVIEHFTDLFSDMKALLKHLNPDGVLYAGVPNIDHFSKQQFQNAHIHYFTPRTFKHYMKKCGLEMIEFGSVKGNHMYGVFKLEDYEQVENGYLSTEYLNMKNKIALGKWKTIIARWLEQAGLKNITKKLIKYFIRMTKT